MKYWIITLLILLIGIEIHNSITLRQLKKIANKKKRSLPNKAYFELKSKFQMYTAVGAIALLLLTFFGWDSKKGLDEIRKEYQVSVDSTTKEFSRKVSYQLKVLENSDSTYRMKVNQYSKKYQDSYDELNNVQASLIKNQKREFTKQSDSLIKKLFETNDARIRSRFKEYLTDNQKEFITTIVRTEIERYWNEKTTLTLSNAIDTKSLLNYQTDLFKTILEDQQKNNNSKEPIFELNYNTLEELFKGQNNTPTFRLGTSYNLDSINEQQPNLLHYDSKVHDNIIKESNQNNPLLYPLDTTIRYKQ